MKLVNKIPKFKNVIEVMSKIKHMDPIRAIIVTVSNIKGPYTEKLIAFMDLTFHIIVKEIVLRDQIT